MSTSATCAERLSALLGDDYLLRGADDIQGYATDVYRRLALPFAVARPGSIEELQAVIKTAAETGTPFTIRGGGASYTDGYLSIDSGHLLIDLSRLDRIVTIDELNGFVTVEAGVTWAALSDALSARGFRTPFLGPFSGLVATVGGSVSQNSISHGSGAYGISAESVLAIDIITAQGDLLSTGSSAAGGLPFARHFGPDLTGLFTGDGGAFGVKARITLPLIRLRPAHRPISFAFPDFASMHESMRRIAHERIEDSHFALDAALSQGQIARQDRAGASLTMAMSIIKSSPSLLAGVRQVIGAGLSARRQIQRAAFMTHYIVEGFDDAETKARLHRLRQLVRGLGREIVATVPAVVRGMPFAPLYNTLGPAGERWVPLHGIMPHSAAPAFHDALDAFYAERRADFERLGVWTGGMFSTVGSSGFLYEIAIYWPDVSTAYHASAIPADYLAALPRYPDNPEARDYVHTLKADLIALYVKHGAINFQLGRAYPYASRLEQTPLDLVRAIKAQLDPTGAIAPGALGL
ncbi:FAD-binding oxidoreductase [Sphingobium boeckii]|uniref:D-lactate dehydrogenase (Cytochrome) n=1 Tax=Sphingobium boeckii TaxID=1082345 RepID=A0A7W9ALN1_9SPHN|nr:FAD-binding oxidoreductase [Sphingobium boeckii]MBB5687717.1 D-lactate dehydrogenase (cytochrome) [Sphingobium boeckii]